MICYQVWVITILASTGYSIWTHFWATSCNIMTTLSVAEIYLLSKRVVALCNTNSINVTIYQTEFCYTVLCVYFLNSCHLKHRYSVRKKDKETSPQIYIKITNVMQLGSMFICNCNIALHVSDAFCVHLQVHLETVEAAAGEWHETGWGIQQGVQSRWQPH